jgi:hypothetical protein
MVDIDGKFTYSSTILIKNLNEETLPGVLRLNFLLIIKS